MNDKAVSMLRNVIARPGMYVIPDELKVVVSFFWGMDVALCYASTEGSPLDGFQDWFVERYFGQPTAVAWTALVEQLPDCAELSEEERVSFFLKMVGEFLDETVGEQ